MKTYKNKPVHTYQQMSSELDKVMAKFEDPNIDIDESIKLYELATDLILKIEKYLKDSQNKIEQIDKTTS